MHQYNPHIHHRRSIRLKGYDYAQAGFYFVTICVQNRKCLFGDIVVADTHACPKNIKNNGQTMHLNDAGTMIEKWYYELENKFPDIKCHEMVVMPNHFHCIIENVGNDVVVGADLRVCPNKHPQPPNNPQTIDDAQTDDAQTDDAQTDDDGQSPNNPKTNDDDDGQTIDGQIDVGQTIDGQTINDGQTIDGQIDVGQSHRIAPTDSPLYRVVQWFKTMSTNEYIRGVKNKNWQRFDGKLWQRNYWEHIIRNEKSFQNISDYIVNNPSNWTNDKFYNP